MVYCIRPCPQRSRFHALTAGGVVDREPQRRTAAKHERRHGARVILLASAAPLLGCTCGWSAHILIESFEIDAASSQSRARSLGGRCPIEHAIDGVIARGALTCYMYETRGQPSPVDARGVSLALGGTRWTQALYQSCSNGRSTSDRGATLRPCACIGLRRNMKAA